MTSFYSHGKLLISGEYLVLLGAKALAVPLKKGQHMVVSKSEKENIHWKSSYNNQIWFEAVFKQNSLELLINTDNAKAAYIQKILKIIQTEKDLFSQSLNFDHILEFHPEWGLGSSSTLISNLAKWAEIDPYKLLKKVSNGSGYDIACANAENPIFFQLKNERLEIEKAPFKPEFHEHILFVYLKQKVNSEQKITPFLKSAQSFTSGIKEISVISDELCKAKEIKEFVYLIKKHEQTISTIIRQEPVKKLLFHDFPGEIKSLGAWGGDFVLASASLNAEKQKIYFQQKGFETAFNYKELVL